MRQSLQKKPGLSPIDPNALLLLLAAFLTHGFLLFNDGIFWDDWVTYFRLIEKDWDLLYTYALQNGLPVVGYLRWAFSYFADPVDAMRAAGFWSLVFSAWLIYSTGMRSRCLTRAESLWIALLALIFPAYQAAIFFVNTHYLVGYALFWGSLRLALEAEDNRTGMRYFLRLAALAGFGLSFSLLNSLLVFYFGAVVLFYLDYWRFKADRAKSFFSQAAHYILRHLDYILMPLIFWVVKEWLWPRHGLYSSFNQFKLAPELILGETKNFLLHGLLEPLKTIFSWSWQGVATLLFLFLLIFFVQRRPESAQWWQLFRDRSNARWLFWGGVFGWILALTPYVLVGKSPNGTAVESRHAILTLVPAAMMMVGILQMVFGGEHRTWWKTAGILIPVWLVVNFWGSHAEAYLDWQARAVKDHAIRVILESRPEEQRYSVFWVDDRFLQGREDHYHFYELAGMFKQAWKGEKWIGFDRVYVPKNATRTYSAYFIPRYNLTDFDPKGCQALMTLEAGERTASDLETSLRYFSLRTHPSELDAFLKGIVKISIEPLPAAAATHCK